MFFQFIRKPTQSEIKKWKAKYFEQHNLKANKHAVNTQWEKFLLSVWN